MDIKAEFDKIIEKYGYGVIYVRRDKRVKCRCSDMSEPSSKCSICLGTGDKVNYEDVLTRRSSSVSSDSKVSILRNEAPGLIITSSWYYFFCSEVCPKEGDLILEYGSDKEWKDCYIIVLVEPKMQEYGKIAYYKVLAKARNKGL